MKNSSWYECKIWLIEKRTKLGPLKHHTSSDITSKLFPVAKETWLWQNKRKVLLLLTKDKGYYNGRKVLVLSKEAQN